MRIGAHRVRLVLSVSLAVLVAMGMAATCVFGPGCGNTEGPERGSVSPAPTTDEAAENEEDKMTRNGLVLTVVYDNNPFQEGLRQAWGFACVVEGMEKTVLFDTGGDGSILLDNMEKLRVDAADIDVVVISHAHADHAGGLEGFLRRNPDVQVYLPSSFSGGTREVIEEHGASVVDASLPVRVCAGIHTSGDLGTSIVEQSLYVEAGGRLVVVTGCAHPGIVRILEAAKEETGLGILLAMGGFHLGGTSRQAVEGIVKRFEELGVRYAGPCHCSGDAARDVFREAYGERYLDVGVGRVIDVAELDD